MPSLYIVATPIGNLEDISLRALRLLKQVKLIAAEDTRTTRKLLSTYGIKTPVTSYYEYNKRLKLDYLLGCLEQRDVALVSEAGMPGLSDPGYELIIGAIDRGIAVVPVPGVSAVVTALVISGLPTDQFIYLGFLPRRPNVRKRLFRSLSDSQRTMVAFEAPHRLRATLEDAIAIFGDRRVAICRELTKIHEEVFRGELNQALEHFNQPRGEFTVVIAGKPKAEPQVNEEIERELRRLHRRGIGARDAVRRLSDATGIPRRKLYETWLSLTGGKEG